jgi:uncharacterized damage-inducible protein DinB
VAGPLDQVMRHNAWATLSLLEFCRSLGPEALELSAIGTYGTLYGTLQHLVGGEQWYISLLTGEWLGGRPVRRDERRSLDDLVAVATAVGQRGIALAAVEDEPRRVDLGGGEWATAGVIFAQLVHHGNEHRTQATTILGANGIGPPSLGGWAYGVATGTAQGEMR